jgi:hypothetical protein
MTADIITLPVIRIERQDEDEPHQGPICTECGAEFYYDFVPEKHLGTGLCLDCYYDRRAATVLEWVVSQFEY